MPWFAFYSASNPYVADVPNLADAQSEAHDTQSVLVGGAYPSQAAAQAALNKYHPGSGGKPAGGNPPSGKPKNTGCAWFMVPPSVWQQILHGILNIGNPSFEIAVATYACGSKAATLRKQGYKGYATKAEAQAAATNANLNANPGPKVSNPLTGIDQAVKAVTNPATWWRVFKIVAGAGLILLGLNKLTGAGTQIENVAGKLPKVIPV